MNYYHLTADVELRPSSEDDEDEEVNGSGSSSPVVAQRITQIFESLQASAATDEVVKDPKSRFEAVRRRRSNPLSRQRRKLNTVSGYFSDWAKWLTSSEKSSSSTKKHQ